MSIIPDDQVRTLTPPPSWQETRRENRRQIRQARRKARADAAEKRTRERETAVTSLRDRTERAIRWSAQHGSHCVTINPRDDECRIAETIFEELTDNGYQLTIVLDHTERALKCFDVTWSHDDGSPLTDDERGARFDIVHTAGLQHVGSETIVYGPTLRLPATTEVTPGVHTRWIS